MAFSHIRILLVVVLHLNTAIAVGDQCADPNYDPCRCEGCDDSMQESGCTSMNGGCCYYYSTGYLNPKDGTSKNQQWTCSAFHPASKGIEVNAGGKAIQDPKTKLFSYNPERVCYSGAGESGSTVVHIPFLCQEGAQSPCDVCSLDSLKRISEPKVAYVGWPRDEVSTALPGECKVCREGYTLHPLTKGCCPNDGSWDLGERDQTCSAVRRSRGMGMPADGGYCQCRGCAPSPAGQGQKGCGTQNGGCCWYSEDNGGTCTDTKLPGMTKPQRVCNIFRGDSTDTRPPSVWECMAGANEPCAMCGGYDYNATEQAKRPCTKCNAG